MGTDVCDTGTTGTPDQVARCTGTGTSTRAPGAGTGEGLRTYVQFRVNHACKVSHLIQHAKHSSGACRGTNPEIDVANKLSHTTVCASVEPSVDVDTDL